MPGRAHRLPVATPIASRSGALAMACAMALVALSLVGARTVAAQAHDHAASENATARDARLELVLGGPHLILYHRGYLGLSDAQVTGLQRLRRAVCAAEVVYVERSAGWRDRLPDLLADSAPLQRQQSSASTRPSRLHEAMNGLAAAESEWLQELMRARRDALALLTAPQRAQVSALREHWVRESVAMIEEATRPGQRGHPGTQIPIRAPGMVVGATTLLPYCEALHGPSVHVSIPPPR